MLNRLIWVLALIFAGVLSGCVSTADSDAKTLLPTDGDSGDAFLYSARLGRGINLGNALEAPSEGAWGMVIEDDFFPTIREAGFDSVRIPIKWSGYTESEPPYTLDESILARVDHVVQTALEHDLAVVMNIHHFEEIMSDPRGSEARFFAIWTQLAAHYQAYPDTLYFEILNEPHNALTDSIWNSQWQAALKIIRQTNPMRPVIVGPTNWNSIDKLSSLQLPDNEPNLIVTFHYYSPFEFTHQGAEWATGASAWLGTEWSGTEREMRAVRRDFDRAQSWAEKQGVPLFLGEFGAYSKADMASRERWTAFIVSEAEARGFSFAYWEFGAGFGAFDRGAGAWRPELLGALIQE